MSASRQVAPNEPPPKFILELDGFSCEMLDAQKRPRQLYAIAKKAGSEIECFVEAVEGEAFMLRISRHDGPHTYKVETYLGNEHFKSVYMRPQTGTMTHSYRRISETAGEPLIFGKVTTTDKDDSPGTIRDIYEAARLCAASVVIRKVKNIRSVARPYKASGKQPMKNPTVWEKVKKVGAVRFDTAPAVPIKKRHYSRTEAEIDNSVPALSFAFHCVTRIGLEVRSIVPRVYTNSEAWASQSQVATQASNPRTQTSGASSSKRSRQHRADSEDEDDVDVEEAELRVQEAQARLEQARLREKRRRLQERRSQGNTQSTQAESSYSSVKNEPVIFDFSNGGTADRPLELSDLDD